MECLFCPMIGSHLYALSLIEYSDSFEKLHIRPSKWIMYEQEARAASNDSPAGTNFIAVFLHATNLSRVEPDIRFLLDYYFRWKIVLITQRNNNNFLSFRINRIVIFLEIFARLLVNTSVTF